MTKADGVITLTEADAALDTLEGMVNKYVRGSRVGKRDVTLADIDGQLRRAKRSDVPEETIRTRIHKGATDPPNADP